MRKDMHVAPQPLSTWELQAFAHALELSWPTDAIVKGVWWQSSEEQRRNYQVTVWDAQAAVLCSTWVAERAGDTYRVMARPANLDELEAMLDALRELDALEQDASQPCAEAQYDCRTRTYQLCFTALEAMFEDLPYKRWVFRRHDDGRPLSVGYICETRRGGSYVTLPGGSVLRGNPWAG